MPYQLKSSDINLQTLSFVAFRLYKSAAQKLGAARHNGHTIVVPILGIQRSGTSLMYWVFERDLGVKVYRESSKLSSLDAVEHIRLNPLADVKTAIERHHVPMVVFKPLVESQRAHELLTTFPEARVLWAYRHYQDVAASNLKAFGTDNGKRDLQPFLAGDPGNWRSQNSSAETRETIRSHYADDMNPFDAAALFWWARMQLYFEQHLDQHPSVMLSRYEDLVLNPARTMRRTYAFLGRAYPGDHIVKDVNAQSVGKGRVSKLTPAVDQLCGQMLERLDRLNETAAQALEAKIERDGSPEMLTNGDSVYAG
ncbi:MAG: sulfotransferase [Anaerolineae bacterium]|uniref:sulfotransferase domain-containing protein n=1 Tax=Promineifilum sp. TaxID=2664178 RepID=UPI001DBCA029|nr:sulfotransferase [Anaerolineales bacterium]MCB8935234.1 sulfotransferase [Promineifilum sp.]MCO5178981.1 sulfotransferase [Promineifilum sp.]MCW5846218.1 sulfotransferase [Anaerolineae bacterium]